MDKTMIILYSIYGILILSILSCLLRMDYNVIIGFGLTLISRNYYSFDQKNFSKIILHVILLSVIFDVAWMIFIFPYWNNEYYTDEIWSSYSYLRTLCKINAVLELGLKGVIFYFELQNYNSNFPNQIKDLISLDYNTETLDQKQEKLNDKPNYSSSNRGLMN